MEIPSLMLELGEILSVLTSSIRVRSSKTAKNYLIGGDKGLYLMLA